MSGPAIAAALTVAYLLATVGVFRVIAAGVPPWLESVLSAFATPGVLAMLAWTPLLRRLGLARGEMVTVPAPPAFIALCLLYAALAWVVVWAVLKLLHR